SQTATGQLRWNHSDASFDWSTLTLADYGREAQLGSMTTGDIINTNDPRLDRVRDAGKKILMWQGTADQLITAENGLEYYTRVAAATCRRKKTSASRSSRRTSTRARASSRRGANTTPPRATRAPMCRSTGTRWMRRLMRPIPTASTAAKTKATTSKRRRSCNEYFLSCARLPGSPPRSHRRK